MQCWHAGIYIYEFTVMSIYSHNSPLWAMCRIFHLSTPLSYYHPPPSCLARILPKSTRGAWPSLKIRHTLTKTPRVNSGHLARYVMWHEDTYLTKLYKTSLVQTVLSLTQPLKNDAWKTIPSYWVSVTFQGRAVKLREGNPKCSRPTITLPPGSGSTKSSCRGVALKTSWRHWATHPQNKHPKKDQLNLYRNYKPCIYTNYMHNILYIVYIYTYIWHSYIDITYNYVYIYIYYGSLCAPSL